MVPQMLPALFQLTINLGHGGSLAHIWFHFFLPLITYHYYASF